MSAEKLSTDSGNRLNRLGTLYSHYASARLVYTYPHCIYRIGVVFSKPNPFNPFPESVDSFLTHHGPVGNGSFKFTTTDLTRVMASML